LYIGIESPNPKRHFGAGSTIGLVANAQQCASVRTIPSVVWDIAFSEIGFFVPPVNGWSMLNLAGVNPAQRRTAIPLIHRWLPPATLCPRHCRGERARWRRDLRRLPAALRGRYRGTGTRRRARSRVASALRRTAASAHRWRGNGYLCLSGDLYSGGGVLRRMRSINPT